jgi:hypothetical protein
MESSSTPQQFLTTPRTPPWQVRLGSHRQYRRLSSTPPWQPPGHPNSVHRLVRLFKNPVSGGVATPTHQRIAHLHEVSIMATFLQGQVAGKLICKVLIAWRGYAHRQMRARSLRFAYVFLQRCCHMLREWHHVALHKRRQRKLTEATIYKLYQCQLMWRSLASWQWFIRLKVLKDCSTNFDSYRLQRKAIQV